MIKIAGYFTGFSSKTDHTIALRFNTQEVSGEEYVDLQSNLGGFGTIAFFPNGESVEVPEEEPVEEGKTHSERLRAVIWRLWEKKGKEGDFEAFRRMHMEKLIELYKAKLD
jgi:hypothetical protein